MIEAQIEVKSDAFSNGFSNKSQLSATFLWEKISNLVKMSPMLLVISTMSVISLQSITVGFIDL